MIATLRARVAREVERRARTGTIVGQQRRHGTHQPIVAADLPVAERLEHAGFRRDRRIRLRRRGLTCRRVGGGLRRPANGLPVPTPQRRAQHHDEDDEADDHRGQRRFGSEGAAAQPIGTALHRRADEQAARVGAARHARAEHRPLNEIPRGMHPHRHPDAPGDEVESGEHQPRLHRDRQRGDQRRIGVGEVHRPEQQRRDRQCRPQAARAHQQAEHDEAQQQFLGKSGAQRPDDVGRPVAPLAGRQRVDAEQAQAGEDEREHPRPDREAGEQFGQQRPGGDLHRRAPLAVADRQRVDRIGDQHRSDPHGVAIGRRRMQPAGEEQDAHHREQRDHPADRRQPPPPARPQQPAIPQYDHAPLLCAREPIRLAGAGKAAMANDKAIDGET
ncbi:hypothetical protein WR25_02897 [Diploscapter pachys]|uniref:Uncharacterized protein n=1 Tax=Diploscapter pachys TaxID=2018661 RepID=A0A2A2KCL2_9BILA|nr:hypothetical protein WR25_02897 [Diploscapter pachys]